MDLGSCVKQHYDVGMYISSLVTEPWVFEINAKTKLFFLTIYDIFVETNCLLHSYPHSINLDRMKEYCFFKVDV